MRRVLLLIVVAAGLAPGTWLRAELPPPDYRQELTVRPTGSQPDQVGELEVEGVWHLTSRNDRFGAYSALLALPGGRLLAGSDRGDMLLFAPPDEVRGSSGDFVQISRFGTDRKDGDKFNADLEALTRDPATGETWAAFEGSNTIERRDADLANPVRRAPAALEDWSGNSGAEAMVRLADGRFVVLREGKVGFVDPTHLGVLFSRDPVRGGRAKLFTAITPDGHAPVDMTLLPDGRVLILLRKVIWGLPPDFSTMIAVADPAEIKEGGEWTMRPIARLGESFPRENYEGIAAVPGPDDSVIVWLISDDNTSAFQRTLLARFVWPAKAQATSKSQTTSASQTKRARDQAARPR